MFLPFIAAVRVQVRLLDSSNPLHIFSYSFLVVLVIGTFWLLVEAGNNVGLNKIDDNETKWLAQKIDDYEYTFIHGCMFIEKFKVRVSNGLLLNGQHENSLEFLFNQSRNALLTAHKHELKFHPLGFPMLLTVDWQESVFDDECFYSIEDFEVIVNNEL